MNAKWAQYLLAGAGYRLRQEQPETARAHDETLLWEGGGLWPAPLESTDPEAAASWLDARYPPDCRRGIVEGDSALFCGAIGFIAYAVEESFPAPHSGSLVSTLLRSSVAAKKGTFAAERVMARREFGWRRPVLFVGSATTKTGRVMIWDPSWRPCG